MPNKFFSFKNRKLILKTENKGKKQLPNIPLFSLFLFNKFEQIILMLSSKRASAYEVSISFISKINWCLDLTIKNHHYRRY